MFASIHINTSASNQISGASSWTGSRLLYSHDEEDPSRCGSGITRFFDPLASSNTPLDSLSRVAQSITIVVVSVFHTLGHCLAAPLSSHATGHLRHAAFGLYHCVNATVDTIGYLVVFPIQLVAAGFSGIRHLLSPHQSNGLPLGNQSAEIVQANIGLLSPHQGAGQLQLAAGPVSVLERMGGNSCPINLSSNLEAFQQIEVVAAVNRQFWNNKVVMVVGLRPRSESNSLQHHVELICGEISRDGQSLRVASEKIYLKQDIVRRALKQVGVSLNDQSRDLQDREWVVFMLTVEDENSLQSSVGASGGNRAIVQTDDLSGNAQRLGQGGDLRWSAISGLLGFSMFRDFHSSFENNSMILEGQQHRDLVPAGMPRLLGPNSSTPVDSLTQNHSSSLIQQNNVQRAAIAAFLGACLFSVYKILISRRS